MKGTVHLARWRIRIGVFAKFRNGIWIDSINPTMIVQGTSVEFIQLLGRSLSSTALLRALLLGQNSAINLLAAWIRESEFVPQPPLSPPHINTPGNSGNAVYQTTRQRLTVSFIIVRNRISLARPLVQR